MSTKLTEYDHYLSSSGPAALVIRESLIPVEGADAVFFPPTYAASEDKTFKGGYNIDLAPNGENIVLVDSVGSQANRIEPMFAEPDYECLVPQVVIRAGAKSVSLFQAGHRAGDAIVRCSALQKELEVAFKKVLDGDASTLARIAPTSLVFGVWDSRATQAKMPRLVSSTIRAFNVVKLTRSSQYWAGGSPNSITVYEDESVLGPIKDDTDKKERSSVGFTHVPATGSHGGVIAKGGIRRDATLALAALNLISAGTDKEETLKLRRYILGLALVAFTRLPAGYLRQGTILVSDPDKPRTTDEVYPDGKRKACTITHKEALEYAKEAARAFGVGANREEPFDTESAKRELEGKETKGTAKAKKTK